MRTSRWQSGACEFLMLRKNADAMRALTRMDDNITSRRGARVASWRERECARILLSTTALESLGIELNRAETTAGTSSLHTM